MLATASPPTTHEAHAEAIVDYYQQTLADYRVWSAEGHCHFGYWRWGIGWWDRAAQLREMCRQVLQRLAIPADEPFLIGDLGCGTGALARWARRQYPCTAWRGFTLSPHQAREALRHHDPQVAVGVADYHDLPLEANSLDAACFVESFCHSPRQDAALAEAHRVLRPGARLVIADGFANRSHPPFWLKPLVELIKRNWVLPGIADLSMVKQLAAQAGWRLCEAKEIGWRLAPSALQGPFLAAWQALRIRLSGQPIGPRRWQHLAACALSVLLGMQRHYFGYWLLVFEKPQ